MALDRGNSIHLVWMYILMKDKMLYIYQRGAKITSQFKIYYVQRRNGKGIMILVVLNHAPHVLRLHFVLKTGLIMEFKLTFDRSKR